MTEPAIIAIADSALGSQYSYRRELPARAEVSGLWPHWLPRGVREAAAASGIDHLWSHQLRSLELLGRGTDTVLATGTASGKSLVYQLMALAKLTEDDRATVLYLAPTKALGHDQARGLAGLSPTVRIGVLDGDTPSEERVWIRDYAQFVVTNPDLVNATLLPRHQQWRRLLAHCALIVVDECHVYRGVFGSHVSLILRRLLRMCEVHGQTPVVIALSATTGDPGPTATRLTGREMVAVTEDGSPCGRRSVWISQPDSTRQGGPGVQGQAAALLAQLVAAGHPTLAFVPSRRGVEHVAALAREILTGLDDPAHPRAPGPPDDPSGAADRTDPAGAGSIDERILAYRAGFLPEERRDLESRLRAGQLLGAATTNALELGMDISGLDAVVVCGWPGRRTSFWQQAGRAGRAGDDSLVVMLAGDDPLDSYLLDHPEAVFDTALEISVIDPENSVVLGPHLCAAAAESPLQPSDLEMFGPTAGDVAEDLLGQGLLRARPRGLFWAGRGSPEGLSDIRAIGGSSVQIVEHSTGRLLGTVSAGQAGRSVHAGAVYTHQGVTFLVDELDLNEGVALVREAVLDYSTTALTSHSLTVTAERDYRSLGAGRLSWGSVEVTSQVHSFLRRRNDTGEVLGSEPLELPASSLQTASCWWTLPDSALSVLPLPSVPGAAHAAEHAAIGLLPLVASCDRWDVGGVSTAHHPDTASCTVFVYDGYPGGAGFARRGFDKAETWLTATWRTVTCCPCEDGCPRCVQSPKCGNGNEPLDKFGASALLGLLVG